MPLVAADEDEPMFGHEWCDGPLGVVRVDCVGAPVVGVIDAGFAELPCVAAIAAPPPAAAASAAAPIASTRLGRAICNLFPSGATD